MFAVVRTGGKQYRVAPDDVFEVGKIAGDVGTIVQLRDVLLLGGENPVLGAPTVNGASVAVEVIEHKRGPKIIAFKKRPRKNSHRKRGYRDQITVLRVKEVLTDGRSPNQAVATVKAASRGASTQELTQPRTEKAGPLQTVANGLFRKRRENVSGTPSFASTDQYPDGVTSSIALPIVEDMGNANADTRVAALAKAAEVMCQFDRSKKMDKSERLRQATLPRRVYEKLFDSNADVARQAAYTLVVSSKSFNHGRKPGRLTDLKRTEIDGVRKDLQRLLPKLGRRFFSYVDVKRLHQTDASIDASIRIRISRALPFSMNDEPVIVDGPNPAPKDASFTVMSVSSAATEVKRVYGPSDKEWANGDLFVADCKVHLPLRKGQVVKALPIAFEVDGLGTTRRELKLNAKAHHAA